MAAGVITADGGLGRVPAGLVVSFALHLALIALLLLPAPPHAPPEERGIDVEIIAPEAARPPSPPATSPVAPSAGIPAPRLAPPTTQPLPATPPPAITPPNAAAPPLPPGWIGATTLLSGSHLAEPRNRRVAAHIAAMPADLRDEQLCDFEAVEQTSRPGKPADQVIAYAFAEPRQTPGQMRAEGAAVRIAGLWYRLAFDCRVTGTPATVSGFAHKLGGTIPRRLWAEYGLAAGGDD